MTAKECEYCGQKIKDKDKHVLLATIWPNKKHEVYFHFQCFQDNHNEKVQAKARAIVQNMQGKALSLLGSVQQTMGNLAGGEQLQQMLNIDLVKEIPNVKDEVNIKSKEDGRKKTKKRK